MSTESREYPVATDVTTRELFLNHDGLRPAADQSLVGRELELHLTDGSVLRVTFRSETVELAGGDDPLVPTGSAAYEAMAIGDGVSAAAIDSAEWSILLVLDDTRARAALVVSRMVDEQGEIVERTEVIDAGVGAPTEQPMPRSGDLVGLRVHWRYSDTHSFEHIYLDSHMYCWHGIEGPEAGMGGVEPASAREVRDALYLFTWSDTSVPFNGAILIDLADLNAIRSNGRLVGWDEVNHKAWTLVVGANGALLNRTSYAGL
jgi:hypothetical protein